MCVELRSYIFDYIQTRSDDQPQTHYLNWKLDISILPQQNVLSSRHPTPQPILHVNLEYHLVGRLTDTQLTWAYRRD